MTKKIDRRQARLKRRLDAFKSLKDTKGRRKPGSMKKMTTSMPICPACGDKSPNAKSPEQCKKCGLPNSTRDEGRTAIARWKRKGVTMPVRHNRNKHGRVGVRR